MAMLPDPFGTFLQFQQALDALRGVARQQLVGV